MVCDPNDVKTRIIVKYAVHSFYLRDKGASELPLFFMYLKFVSYELLFSNTWFEV